MNQPNKLEKTSELSFETQEEASLDKGKDFLDYALELEKEGKEVSTKNIIESNPELKQTLAQTVRDKQKMIIEDIKVQDLAGASLRDKAMSAKALHEQAQELEGKVPIGGIELKYVVIKNERNVATN